MTAKKGMGVREVIREGTPHYPSEPKGDESYRFYFTDPEEFRAAMIRAKQLELAKCPRRAWRVRMNLDGNQPTYAAPSVEVETPLVTYRNKLLPPQKRDRKAEHNRRLLRANRGRL